jgi:malonyl-CoA decarboxylase
MISWKQLITLGNKAKADGGFSQLVDACHQLVSERGQANLYALATAVVDGWNSLQRDRYEAFFAVLATEFSPDQNAVMAAAKAYTTEPTPATLAALATVTESPRQELFRRINRTTGGTTTLLAMRVALMGCMRTRKGLEAVDADFLHLLTSWFNPGFLHFEPVSWHSPAVLLEKIIAHEAVHAIASWTHLRRRLESDRRCYAFFHPQLPNEPLIFVEVALTREIPGEIAPLIALKADEKEGNTAKSKAKSKAPNTAVFYSISNCQPGLRGVSLGNFLIKRVAEHLANEVPTLETFCTLSPVPSLTKWLDKVDASTLPAAVQLAYNRVKSWLSVSRPLTQTHIASAPVDVRDSLMRLCTHLLVRGSHMAMPDPVARFHLDNGARLEAVHVGADLSAKGLKESLSVMVNYLYDLDAVEARHEAFVNHDVVYAAGLKKWLKG